MIAPIDSSGTGLGGPGMWDPMPLIPPSSPPAQASEPKFIWSRPAQAAPDEKKKAGGTKKTTKKKAAKKTTTGKKKAAKKKPLKKKTAGRAKKRR